LVQITHALRAKDSINFGRLDLHTFADLMETMLPELSRSVITRHYHTTAGPELKPLDIESLAYIGACLMLRSYLV
jgi:hypothetical protein